MVSKAVEFKFLKKLLILLGMEDRQHLPTVPAETPPTIAMETDTDLCLEETLTHLLVAQHGRKSETKQRSILNALKECLELLWKYDVYQVHIFNLRSS